MAITFVAAFYEASGASTRNLQFSHPRRNQCAPVKGPRRGKIRRLFVPYLVSIDTPAENATLGVGHFGVILRQASFAALVEDHSVSESP